MVKKLSGLMAIAVLSMGLLTATNINSTTEFYSDDLVESTKDFMKNPGVKYLNDTVFNTNEAVEYSKTYAQYGLDSEGRYCLRFATAVKGNIETLSYTRGKVASLNKEEVTKPVDVIYNGIKSGEEISYYDGTDLTTDSQYAGNYYWACYTICFTDKALYDTDVTVNLNINGTALPSKTGNLGSLLMADGNCYEHSMVATEAREVKYNADGNKAYYTCSKCNKVFLDEAGTQETTLEETTIKSDGWLRFGISTSTDGNGVKSTRANINDTLFENKEVLTSRITFDNELASGTKFNFHTHVNNALDGVNARVRQISGKTLEYKVLLRNNTENPLNLKIRLNDVDANSAVTINLSALETKVVESSYVCSGNTTGGWMQAEIVDTVASGSSFDFLGYMKTKDYWDYDKTLHVLSEATTTTFKVGETFNSDGLLVDIKNDASFDDTVANIATNYDNHVFTNEDVGIKTVKVMFGGASYEYDIKVLPAGHIHNNVHYPKVSATYNADGSKEYYYCDGCNKYFADANGNEEIMLADTVLKSDGWLRFGLSNSTDGNGVKSTRAKVNDTLFENKEVTASRVTFDNELAAGTTFNFHTSSNNPRDGVNARVRQISGKTLEYKVIVKNNTENPLNLKIRLNDVDANSAVVITLNGFETKTIESSYVCSGNTSGGWMKAEIVDTVASGSSFDFLGYMKTKDYWDYDKTLHVLSEATTTTFKVGETFNSDGLLAYLTNDIYNDTVANFATNYDNHVFTSDEIGTKTVKVMFGGATYEYNINIVE